MECGDLLYGTRFHIELKWVVYDSYARPAILYGSETWCLKESEIGILRRTERSMVRAMCGVQLKYRNRLTDLILMLGLKESMDQLVWSCVEERGWSRLTKGIIF